MYSPPNINPDNMTAYVLDISYLWQSRIEIKYYSALVNNELTALGFPPVGVQVWAQVIASMSSYAH